MENEKSKNMQTEIANIEAEMLQSDFWNDKDVAQQKIKKMQELKNELEGFGKYDSGNAVLTIFAGAGGDDAEDWVRILLEMYSKYADKNNYQINFIDENQNDQGGYRSVAFEIVGKMSYLNLKNESGVHRLVRISPFNSAGKRQTSFALVEVVPCFDKSDNSVSINPEEIEIEYTKSSGPGGQNVNKRETAVRITHTPTKISVLSSNQRSQIQNKEKAIEILKGKLYKLKLETEKKSAENMSISKNTTAEWGSQIRSYIMHPYQLVKDHRINLETSNINNVLNGDLELFVSGMKNVNI